MATKISAPRRGWPTRDRALLIADPSPEWLAGIEPISVLVSGATTIEIPIPNRITAGRTSMSTSTGGMRVSGRPRSASHGAEDAGIRAYQSKAAAMMSGPATRKIRGPKRPVRPPIRADSTASRMPLGSPTIAAPCAL